MAARRAWDVGFSAIGILLSNEGVSCEEASHAVLCQSRRSLAARGHKTSGLTVVGVHTPEFPNERVTDNVKDALQRYGIRFPVAQDNAYATWNAYGNQYWPAFYLIDKHGRVAYTHVGEGDYEETEAWIQKLLAEKN